LQGGRFDVAVNDGGLVRVQKVQCIGNRITPGHHIFDGVTLFIQSFLQVDVLDVVHHKVPAVIDDEVTGHARQIRVAQSG